MDTPLNDQVNNYLAELKKEKSMEMNEKPKLEEVKKKEEEENEQKYLQMSQTNVMQSQEAIYQSNKLMLEQLQQQAVPLITENQVAIVEQAATEEIIREPRRWAGARRSPREFYERRVAQNRGRRRRRNRRYTYYHTNDGGFHMQMGDVSMHFYGYYPRRRLIEHFYNH